MAQMCAAGGWSGLDGGLGLLAELVVARCYGERRDDRCGGTDQLNNAAAGVVGDPDVARRIDGEIERAIEDLREAGGVPAYSASGT